jgi:trehalose 6-phosphate synthase
MREDRDIRTTSDLFRAAEAPGAVAMRPPLQSTLLVVSNRLPELRSPVGPGERPSGAGGLVSALEPVMTARSGIWLGWSGRCVEGEPSAVPARDDRASPALAWIDFPRRWIDLYYGGLCNRALWPLFHTFPESAHFSDAEWACYSEVNEAFAEAAGRLVASEGAVWAHDYHLLLLARALRRKGHRGPLGLFLHVPFPPIEVFSIFPWAEELLEAMLDFDLLGFQTRACLGNFRSCVGALTAAAVGSEAVEHSRRRVRIRSFPIGIVPERFEPAGAPGAEVAELLASLGPSRLILGVDRLDYTKGIPARLRAFGRLLREFPEWRGKVSMIQVSVPSRAELPEYGVQRGLVESFVGRVNGEFGRGAWTPVRYLYRPFGREQLSQLYRAAAVGLVTPLRDGMNLVAKEYVAAQDPARPGVLVLSKFAGAAAELREAVLTNPYHEEGLARDIDRALRMPLEERRFRQARLAAAVSRSTALSWADEFVRALTAER